MKCYVVVTERHPIYGTTLITSAYSIRFDDLGDIDSLDLSKFSVVRITGYSKTPWDVQSYTTKFIVEDKDGNEVDFESLEVGTILYCEYRKSYASLPLQMSGVSKLVVMK